MRVADFDFNLPPERIALRPAFPREAAKLLVVRPNALEDRTVADLPSLLRAGDVLVFNDTKVIPAALHGHRIGRLGTTPKIEALLHQRLDGSRWRAFVKPAKKLEKGDRVRFGSEGRVCLLGKPVCSDHSACAAHTKWKTVSERNADFFRDTTVADLTK